MAVKKPRVPRTIRVDEELWDKVNSRAEDDGLSRGDALHLLLMAYASKHISLPRVQLTYAPDVTGKIDHDLTGL